MPTRKSRSGRTREDVKNEFGKMASDLAATPSMDPRAAGAAAERTAKAKSVTAQLTDQAIIETIGTARLLTGNLLSSVQDRVLAEYGVLKDLRDAVEAERAELQRLTQIDLATAKIEVLIQEHNEKLKTLEADFLARKASYDQQVKDLAAHIDVEKKAMVIARQREADSYEYEKTNERRDAKDEFEQELLAQRRANDLRQLELERSWKEREAAVAKAEDELAALRATVAGIEDRVKKEAKAAEAITEARVKRELDAEHELAKRDLTTQLKLAEQAQLSLKTQLEAALGRVAKLEADVTAARASVQEMALAAFREAGSARALAEVTSSKNGESPQGTSRARS